MARATRETNRMDALTLLKKDHEAAKDLFEQFEEAGQEEQEGIAQLVCRLLTVHTRIEEEIFYPAAREAVDDTELVEEAEVEHGSARTLIASIEGMDAGDEKYAATVKVLGEYVKHHLREEEGELFPRVKKGGMDIEAVGERLAARRMELMSEMGMAQAGQPEMAAMQESRAATGGARSRSQQRGQTDRQHARSGARSRASSSRGASTGGSGTRSAASRGATKTSGARAGGKNGGSSRSASRRSANR